MVNTKFTSDNFSYGTCSLSSSGIVIHQNEVCRQICGDSVNKECVSKQFSPCRMQQCGENGIVSCHAEICSDGTTVLEVVGIKTPEAIDIYLCEPRESLRNALAKVNFSALSRRQREVLVLRLSGKTNDGICEILGISKNTLKSHLKKLTASDVKFKE